MITYNDLVLRNLKKALTDQLTKVFVGVFDHGMRPEGDISNFELAIIHEYGTDHVPERSFLRRAVLNNQVEFSSLVQRLVHSVFLQKKTMPQVMRELGEWGVEKTKQTILDGVPPPLDANTIRQKGHAQPLVETMRLFTSVEYRTGE